MHYSLIQDMCALRSTQLIADDLESVPDCGGIYMVFGDTTELLAGTGYADMEVREPFMIGGTELLYIGCSNDLRARIACHVKDDSTASNFRMSMGCLLRDQLDLEVFTHPLRATFHFGQGEARLTRWLCMNTAIAIWPCTQPRELERALIKALPAPININDRRRHPYARVLMEMRGAASDQAGRAKRKRQWKRPEPAE